MERFNLTALFLISILLSFPRQAENFTARVAAMMQGAAKPDIHTWYVRPDGGDRKQCNGHTDAAYSGRGNGQACAFKNPYYLFTTGEYGNKQWVSAGGDTMILRGGPYRIGFRGPNRDDYWGSCPGDAYGCGIPPLPSGTPGHPTRLLGEHYGNCTQKTQLFGGFEVYIMMDLSGSKNVDIECLELTDHSQCVKMGSGYPPSEGCGVPSGLADFASSGISTNAETANVALRDLDIHGLASRGIIGPIGGDITAERVRIAFNGAAGWDFDDGRGTKSAAGATVRAQYLAVEWNGCNEEYPITHAVPVFSCFDQEHGGYGDGIGTPNTPLNFICDHCVFRYNTQDGFDLLHIKGSQISVTNSVSYGNMGQQWKMGTMTQVLFQNNLTVNNCRRMSAPMPGAADRYNRYLSLYCRAGGDGIVFSIADGGTYVFQHNSFAGYGGANYDITCDVSCSKANIIYQNNLNIGYKDTGSGKAGGIVLSDGCAFGRFFSAGPQYLLQHAGNLPHEADGALSGPEDRGNAGMAWRREPGQHQLSSDERESGPGSRYCDGAKNRL